MLTEHRLEAYAIRSICVFFCPIMSDSRALSLSSPKFDGRVWTSSCDLYLGREHVSVSLTLRIGTEALNVFGRVNFDEMVKTYDYFLLPNAAGLPV